LLPISQQFCRLIVELRYALRHLDHAEGDGRLLFEQILKMDLEGIVCKRKDSPYKGDREAFAVFAVLDQGEESAL
jgi:ATP-dependent DNA ligase